MKIQLHEIPVREVYKGYVNDAEEGVVGYGGKYVPSNIMWISKGKHKEFHCLERMGRKG